MHRNILYLFLIIQDFSDFSNKKRKKARISPGLPIHIGEKAD